MLCPSCNKDGAYVGLLTIECANEECKHFNINAPGYVRRVYSTPKAVSEPIVSISEDLKTALNSVIIEKRKNNPFYPFQIQSGASDMFDAHLWIEIREVAKDLEIPSCVACDAGIPTVKHSYKKMKSLDMVYSLKKEVDHHKYEIFNLKKRGE